MAETDVWLNFFDHDTNLLQHGLERLYLNETILHLMRKTQARGYEGPIVNAKITDIEVWKFRLLTLDPRGKQMGELLSNLTFTDNKDSDIELVDQRTKMEELQLKEFEPLLVRVVQKAIVKRKGEDDYREGARRCKLAHIEPSKANNASVYETLQESQQDRILDDCPKRDSDIPPLPLLYSGFGEFRDFITNSAQYPDTFSKEAEVDELVDAMCFLGYEKDKRTKMQDILHTLFAGPQRKFDYSVENGTQAATDGYVSASHGGPLLILEFKRQINFAEGQLAGYFIRLALKSGEDVFHGWRQPGLGIIIRGTLISFVGLVMIDTQVRVLHLAHPFISNDSEIEDRIPLYATFEAACHLLSRIEQDAAHLVAHPPPFISGSYRRLPNVCSLLRVSGNVGQGERISFKITQRLETSLKGQHLLYLATTGSDQTQIIVKFSKQYSKELHEFCASINHAPKLLGFERLPGGWFGIAMVYFASANCILESNNLRDHGETWLKEIDKVVEEFHAQDYVHGDLRPPNFIVNGARLLLIDFDWGGKEGDARFPRKRLHEILRDSRSDMMITKVHDNRIKDYTKRLIGEEIKRAR